MDDGTWAVRVCRSATDEEVIGYPDKEGALAGAEALRVAHRLLTPSDQAPVIAHVRGPTRDGNRWVMRWTEDGVNRATTGTRGEMQKIRDELLGAGATKVAPLPKRHKFGTPDFFKRSLQDALNANWEATNNRDFDGIKASRQRIEAIKDTWSTLSPIMGLEGVEDQLENLLDYLETHGHLVKKEGASELVPTTPGLAEALSGDIGPWESVDRPRDEVSNRGRGKGGRSN